MAKTSTKRPPSRKTGRQRVTLRQSPNWPLLALSVLGMALACYLTFTAWTGGSVKGCTAGSACDVVLTSRWSTLFGYPTSFWGLLAYASLAGIAFVKRADTHWKLAWIVSLFGMLFSVYLTIISLFVLEAACPYCLSSLALMTAILAVVIYQRPADLGQFSWPPWLGKTLAGAAAGVLVAHLHFAGILGKPPAPEDPTVRALAEHLTKSGAKFYGASWCPHCKEQKEIFGSSVARLPYIECSPGGPQAPPSRECEQARINTYPTWVINGQRREGILGLKDLAELSRFQGATAPPS
jgi:uncharacterized membrane protein/glutaredoxin